MSENTHSAPIYILNDDILLTIFALNADMFSYDRASSTTRLVSQVCRLWRDLILDAPSLWARLIDMNTISKCRSDQWMKEVVQRSRSAPLWIKADYVSISFWKPKSPHDKSFSQFFFKLIHKNWFRIQRLVFASYSGYGLTRSMLCFPAPRLEYCELPSLRIIEGSKTDASTRPLFANHAPLLRRAYFGKHLFDQVQPWFFQLHSVVIDDSYSVSDALILLSATCSLQELTIKGLSNSDVPKSLPLASLLHLRYLEYRGDSNSGIIGALLDHVQIPKDCSLKIEFQVNYLFDRTRFTLEKHSIVSIINTFAQHVEHISQSHIFAEIELLHAKNSYTSLTLTSEASRVFAAINIPFFYDFDANLLEIFLKKLIQLDLKRAKKISFFMDGRLHPYFGSFFSCLPAIETISIEPSTFSRLAHLQKRYAHKAPKNKSILFPNLRVIDLDIQCYQPSSHRSGFFINSAAAAFLLSRLRAGHPITILDMSKHFILDSPPDLDALVEVKGLKVLYRLSAVEGVIEYICGSDVP